MGMDSGYGYRIHEAGYRIQDTEHRIQIA